MQHINKKDLIILIVLILLSLGLILFTQNNDYLYSKNIMKITKIKIEKQEQSTNSIGIVENHYIKKISGIITNGKNKGKTLTLEYEETDSNVVTEKYKINDKVFIDSNSIDGLKRDTYIVMLVSLFIIAMFIIGKYRGLLAIVSVILNTIIFYYGLELYFKGINLLILCIIESIFFTILSLFISNGKNKKTLSAIISVFISMLFLVISTIAIVKLTNYSGISFNGMSFLTVPAEEIFLAELMIGGLGAIMDVAITLSSSIGELIEKDKTISKKTLKKSTKEIGKDIMSTMINVLFFTYLCSGLPIFVLAIRNGFTMYNYITTNFSLEITRFLIGSIGILITIPISENVALKILKRGDVSE